jgi:hypothetical protein
MIRVHTTMGVEELACDTYKIDESGALHVKVKTKDSQIYEGSWGMPGHIAPPEYATTHLFARGVWLVVKLEVEA